MELHPERSIRGRVLKALTFSCVMPYRCAHRSIRSLAIEKAIKNDRAFGGTIARRKSSREAAATQLKTGAQASG